MNTQQLKERYAPPEIPKCRVCGRELTVQSVGGGPTIWGCTGMIDDPTGERNWIYAEGRSCADEHYERSRWSDYRQGGDADVIALIDRFEAAEHERDELRAEIARRDAAAAGEARSWMTQEQMQSEANIYRHDNDEGTNAWFDAKTALWAEGYLSPSVFHHIFKPDEAGGWLDDEIALIEQDGRSAKSYREIRNGETENPVVAVFDNGRVIVWDGFHRIAAAVARKEHVYAIFAYTAAQPAVLPPDITFESKGFISLTSEDFAYNRALEDARKLGAQPQKVVELPDPVKWPEIPFKYFSEEQVFSMLDAAGVKWEVKK